MLKSQDSLFFPARVQKKKMLMVLIMTAVYKVSSNMVTTDT